MVDTPLRQEKWRRRKSAAKPTIWRTYIYILLSPTDLCNHYYHFFFSCCPLLRSGTSQILGTWKKKACKCLGACLHLWQQPEAFHVVSVRVRVISDSVEKAQPLSALIPSCFHRLAGVRRSVSRSMPSVTQQLLNTITGGLSPARRPIRNKEVSLARATFWFHYKEDACYRWLRGQRILVWSNNSISMNCLEIFVNWWIEKCRGRKGNCTLSRVPKFAFRSTVWTLGSFTSIVPCRWFQ